MTVRGLSSGARVVVVVEVPSPMVVFDDLSAYLVIDLMSPNLQLPPPDNIVRYEVLT